MQQTVNEAEFTVTKLVNERNGLMVQLEEEKRKCEDLLFRFEEESVNKDDIQVCMYVNINVSSVHIHRYDYLSSMIKAEYLVKIYSEHPVSISTYATIYLFVLQI